MAHAFAVTDGTTTFNLSTTNALLVNYAMGTAMPGEETVVDTVDLLIYGTTASLMQAAYRSLTALLDGAKRRSEWGQGVKVYVTAQLDSDGSAWRSEIRTGRIELTEASLAVWANLEMECTLYIERVPFWEGIVTELTLTNRNGTDIDPSDAFITVNNCDDADQDNFADIGSAEVTGDLPAPLSLQLENNNGASRSWGDFWIASNAFNDPANFTGVIEAEARTSGGTVTASAGLSGGNYNTQTASGTITWYYDLPAAMMVDCAGYLFRVLCCFAATQPDGFMRCRVTVNNGATVLAQTEEVALSATLNQGVVDLGTLPLPPAGYATTFGVLEFQLVFRLATSQAVSVDWIQFLPAYACRVAYPHISAMVSGAILVVDDIEEQYFLRVSSVDYAGTLVRGQPVMVWPGRAHRLHFVVSRKTAGAVVPADTLGVKAWYRPRRTHI